MIEDAAGIECLTLDARLEMKVVACCPAGLPFQADGVTGLQPLAHLDKIAGVMAVERLQSVCMTQDDTVSVGKVRVKEYQGSRITDLACIRP